MKERTACAMKARVIILVALLSVLSMGRAEAQRCLPKMQGIELRAGLNEADGYVLGAALSSYAKGGDKWVYGVEYLQTNHGYRSTTIPAAQFTAEGGYYYNFLSDAKKVVFFYVGASALAGYETVNWGEKTLYDGARLNNKDAFVYGCAATLEMEFRWKTSSRGWGITPCKDEPTPSGTNLLTGKSIRRPSR